MAHRAADDGAPRAQFALRSVVHRALDVNANGTRMRNRVCARVYYMYVHGTALRMCLVRPPECRLCGAYAVAVSVITHELVVACSACARAL